MNKLLKYILVALGATSICIASFTNAEPYHGSAVGIQLTSIPFRIDLTTYTCYTTDTTNTYTYSFDNSTFTSFGKRDLVCGRPGDTVWFGGQYNGRILSFPGIPEMTKAQCKSKYSLIEPSECTVMSSLECQTNYNLIPINDVNANYCHVNFGMILPTECPTSEGTGAVSWTPRYINSVQYPGTSLLYINVPEDIAYSVTYNQEETIVDVEGYNADTEYIENVINNEKLTPTNEDFELLLQTTAGFIPYLFIGLLLFFFIKIINKIWK